jgi:Ca-activated chloride channel family protein
MSFLWPAMLPLLLLAPLLLLLYAALQRRRRRLAERFGRHGFALPPAGSPQPRLQPGLRRHLPQAFYMAGFLILLFALARPQAAVSLPRLEGTIILAFDVSGSMAADDLEPTRMEAAKAAAQVFIEKQPPSVLLGVVAFSDSGFTVQAPTNDQEAILATINRLQPERGTSLANGILMALNSLRSGDEPAGLLLSDLTPEPTPTPTPVPEGSFAPAAIILLTDGENNLFPDPLEASAMAAERGVRIYTVGIGSPAGATLEVEGFLVHTQLDEALLQQIAQRTGGAYFGAETEEDLLAVYESLTPELTIKPERMEITALLAGAGLLVWLAGGALSLAWYGRLP